MMVRIGVARRTDIRGPHAREELVLGESAVPPSLVASQDLVDAMQPSPSMIEEKAAQTSLFCFVSMTRSIDFRSRNEVGVAGLAAAG